MQQYILAILQTHFQEANFAMDLTHQQTMCQNLGFLSRQTSTTSPEVLVGSLNVDDATGYPMVEKMLSWNTIIDQILWI